MFKNNDLIKKIEKKVCDSKIKKVQNECKNFSENLILFLKFRNQVETRLTNVH